MGVIGRAGVLLACVALVLVACANPTGTAGVPAAPSATSCAPPAGGRCEGPEPIESMVVSANGRRLATVVMCGGWLRVSETTSVVQVTYVASAVGAGAMSCARVRLTAGLARPLADRAVVDATRGDRVAVTHCGPPARARGDVLTACG